MNTIRANLLPCAGTAGGVPVHPHAAGRHVIICGDLIARRPGEATRNHPLPAERLRRGAFAILNTVERGFRAIFPDAFFDGRRLAASGNTGRSRKLQVQPPISFLGSARVQACKQSSRRIANRFHVQNSLPDAHASCLQIDRSDLECPTKALKRLTR